MKKIKPINSKTLKASKKTYDDLFEDLDFYIKTKLKARGIHDLIFNVYKKKLKEKHICSYFLVFFIYFFIKPGISY